MRFPALFPRQPFVGLALAAIAGIFVADHWPVAPLLAFGFAAGGVLLVLVRPSVLAAWVLCGLIFFELHTVRHYASDARELAQAFAAGPRVAHVTGVVWNEPEKPTVWSRTTTARFRLRLESLEIEGQKIPTSVVMNIAWAGAMPAYGDRVSLVGSAFNIEAPRNPGQFDYAAYEQRQGIYSEIRARFATDCRIESHGHGWPPQAFAFQAAHWIQRQLRLDLENSPAIADLIASMILGLHGDTPDDMRALFQRTGTMHLFAVSGFNIAMLAGIVLAVLRPFGIRRGAAVAIIIPVLAVYTLITGLGASCVRAAIMVTLVLCGQVIDRRALALNSLGAAAFLILIGDTQQLFSPGFQFSFVLVVSLVGLAARIQRPFARIGQPDAFLPQDLWSTWQRGRVWVVTKFAATMGVTIAAWLGSLVFTAGYFHLVSPASIFANLIAVPLSFLILVFGMAALFAAPFWRLGVILCNNANWLCAEVLLKVLHLFAILPGGYVYVEVPHLRRAPVCEITVLDVGEGGAAHVRAGGYDWLLDCGSNTDYERSILPYLRCRGVNRLEGLLLTHGDAHHVGGALGAVADFRPFLLAESILNDRSSTRRNFHLGLVQQAIGKGLYERGDFIHFGRRATMRVLYPVAGVKRSSADDMAIVLQLETAGTRVLFMSDSGFTTEQWLLENEPDLRSDLVIKGQHARDLSGTPEFLARVRPQAVVCTALGYASPPAQLDAWAQECAQQGIVVFRQDQAGAALVDIREGGFEVRGFANGQIFRSQAR